MADDRWARIEQLVQSALARPLAERDAFVREACADDVPLSEEVLSLLARDDSADNFLDSPPSGKSRPVLTPGQTLGRYTIGELIDRGGMGDVYRARDSHPPRDIAIKVLPPTFAGDPDRRRRFDQEARAVAALNHPNIVTLYSVEEVANLHFLTMELVEGKALADLIPRGGLPVERLLDVAIPLADAIGAAHARGIIHRDLKPANVMVTPDGRVKVLDFGLAKLKPIAADNAMTTTPPILTADRRLLGTVAYMSPEQAEGREVDHRSDIFSLGVLLCELTTGQQPFTGDSTMAVLSAIINETPASLTDGKPQIPRELARIVSRCLSKDPERRHQSAKDVRNSLEDLRQDITSGALDRTDSSVARRLRGWRLLAGISLGIATVGVAGILYLGWRGAIELRWQPESPPVPSIASRVEILVPVPESVKSVHSLSVSPDGTQLAFAGGGQLWHYNLATRQVSAVAGVAGEPPVYPFWSPDGRFIAYFQAIPQGHRLVKIPAAGGIPRTICDFEGQGRGGTWGAEDTIVFAQTAARGLFRVSASGGVAIPVTTLASGETAHRWPQFLPDGRHFIFLTVEGLNKVYSASLDPDEPRHLVAPAPGAPTEIVSRPFALAGFLLAAERSVLRAQPLSSGATDPTAGSEPLAQNIPRSGTLGDYLFAASPSVLAYVVAEPRRSQFSLLDPRNREQVQIGPPFLTELRREGRHMWSLSPNGQTLAFTQIADDRGRDIWLIDLTSRARDRFTSGPNNAAPLWSPGTDAIVFTQISREGQDLHVKRLGSESDSLLGETSSTYKTALDWHDKTLLFAMQSPSGVRNFWYLAIDSSRKPELWFASKADHESAQFSPDGRWVAYSSNETGTFEIYLRRFPGADRTVKISTRGGNDPRWRADGTALFYVQDDWLMQVELDIGENVTAGVTRKLSLLGENCGYAVLPPAGARFVVCRPIDPVPPPNITIVLNWAAGLGR